MKLSRNWAALVAAATAMTACMTAPVESVEDSVALVPQTIQFTAGSPATRTAFTTPDGDTYPVIWTDRTDVHIFPDRFDNGESATVTPSADGRTASFSATVGVSPAASYMFYLVSPDCVTANDPSGHVCRFTLPEVQEPTANSVQEEAMILVSTSTPVSSLQETVSFGTVKHWTAYMKFSLSNLSADIGELYGVEISADEPISGSWSYDFDTEKAEVADGVKRIEARVTSPSGIWIGIAPVDLGGKTLTVKAIGTQESRVKTITVPAGKKFESGKIALFSVDMADAEPPAPEVIYNRISEERFVTEGAQFVIATAAENLSWAMSATQGDGFRLGVPIVKSGPLTKSGGEEEVVNPSEEVEVLTVEPGTTSGTWALKTKAGQYLAIDKDKNVALVSINAKTNLSDWRVRYDDAGVCELRNNATSYTYYLRYRKSDNKFLAVRPQFVEANEAIAMYLRDGSGTNDWKKDPELRLVKTSLTLQEGETFFLRVALCYSLNDGGVVTFESEDPTVASVDEAGNVTALKVGQTNIIARVGETENYKAGEAVCQVSVETAQQTLEWVELAPGLKWATFNVGASAPEEPGSLFAWGETEPKSNYDWASYKFMEPGKDYWNYINRYQIDDGSTSCLWYVGEQVGDNPVTYRFVGDGKSAFKDYGNEDDAARKDWGGEWQTPSSNQLGWLVDNCTWTWDAAKKGYTLTSKVSGYTSKSIFLPAAGTKQSDGEWISLGESGTYMGGNLTGSTSTTKSLYFTKTNQVMDNRLRRQGQSVRPVYGYVALTGLALDKSTQTLEVDGGIWVYSTPTPAYASDARVEWTSSDNSVVTIENKSLYDCYIRAKKPGTAVITATAKDGGRKATCTVTVQSAVPDPEWVELAPGLKWATFNVGASAPEELGSKFAWGETEPKESYTWENYKFMTAGYNYYDGINKYQLEDGKTSCIWYQSDATAGPVFVGDGKSAFKDYGYEDDAARKNWGDEWQTPSHKQLEWLIDNCTWTWDATKNGFTVTSKVSGYTSRSIFLPLDATAGTSPLYGSYMSNVLNGTTTSEAYLSLRSDAVIIMNNMLRRGGALVRPVHGTVAVTGVSLDRSTETLTLDQQPWIEAIVTPAYVSDGRVDWSSSNKSVLMVAMDGPDKCRLQPVSPGTAVVTARTKDGGYTATMTVTVKADDVPLEAVDLGLSVKWANKNVGAAKPEDIGDFFAWGETDTKTEFGWDGYKWGTQNALTKYNNSSSNGTVDNKSVLEPQDDAARANLGSQWRMPTNAEIQEMIDNCIFTFKTLSSGEKGYEVKAKSGSNTIFLPLTGMKYLSSETGATVYGGLDEVVLLSKSLIISPGRAGALNINESRPNGYLAKFVTRCSGIAIRPVDASHDVAVSNIRLSSNSLTLAVDETSTLTATVSPTNATIPDVVWSSSNPAVASVDDAGKVTALKAGSATITASSYDGAKAATCSVTVTKRPVRVEFGVRVSPQSTDYNYDAGEDVLHLSNGGALSLSYYVYYSDGTSGYRDGGWSLSLVSGSGVKITNGTNVLAIASGKTSVVRLSSTSYPSIYSDMTVKTWDAATSVTIAEQQDLDAGRKGMMGWVKENTSSRVIVTVEPSTARQKVVIFDEQNSSGWTIQQTADLQFKITAPSVNGSTASAYTAKAMKLKFLCQTGNPSVEQTFTPTNIDLTQPKMLDYISYNASDQKYCVVDGGLRIQIKASDGLGTKDMYVVSKPYEISYANASGYVAVGIVSGFCPGQIPQNTIASTSFPTVVYQYDDGCDNVRFVTLTKGSFHGFAIALRDCDNCYWSKNNGDVDSSEHWNKSYGTTKSSALTLNAFDLTVLGAYHNGALGSNWTIWPVDRTWRYPDPGFEYDVRAWPSISSYKMRPWVAPTVANFWMLRDGNNKLHNGTVVAKFNERIANVGGTKVFYPSGTPYWTISTQNSSYAYEVVETADGDYKMSAVSKQETRYFRPFMVF